MRARGAEYFASEAPAPPDLYERFARYFNGQLRARPGDRARASTSCIWWTVTGAARRRLGDRLPPRRATGCTRGVPDDWNLHITIPDALVYQGVSGQGIWDDIVLSFRVRLARRPDRYMKEFWTWFCKL